MKNFFTFLSILLCSSNAVFSQNTLAKKGTIVLIDDRYLVYNDIKLIDGKFTYIDVTSGLETQSSISEVVYVYDEKNSVLFTNRTLVEKLKEQKKITAEEEKRLFIENKVKQDEEREKLEFPKRLKLLPDGIYATLKDFLAQTPSSKENVVAKGLIGFDKPLLYAIEDNCFFYYANSDEKVRNIFAISYKGHLYFQIQAILNNRNKTDRAQTNDFPNSFTRVQSAGQNYYYLEAELANVWAQGLAYGAVGGAAGGAIAASNIKLKGVVWDIKNQEFNIFKNCSDFNDFIRDKYPNGVQDCEKHQANITQIREAIEKIK